MSGGTTRSFLTDNGRALTAKLVATASALHITKAQLGDGVLPEGQTPYEVTALVHYIMDATIEHVGAPADSQVPVVLQVTPTNITTTFTAREAALFAQDPDVGEILYAYISMLDDPVELRPMVGGVGRILRLDVRILISNVAEVTAEINPTASEELLALIQSHLVDMNNPHKVSAEKVGLGNVPNVGTNDQTPTYSVAGTLAKLVSGEMLAVAFGKLAKGVSDLIAHLANKSNPHGVSPSQIGAAPTASPVFTRSISLGRKAGSTIGDDSFAVGFNLEASGLRSHAEGVSTMATDGQAHAEGTSTTASGNSSHAEGNQTTASSNGSHAEGNQTTASGNSSHAEGFGATASGSSSHAEGSFATAAGSNSHAAGSSTIANGYQYVIGTYNVESTDASTTGGDRFIIGGGSVSARKNCFRVNANGSVYGGPYSSSGADYAELFEWLDRNPDQADRAGLFVTLDGEHIRVAGPGDDYILGIVSACPSVVGDVYDDQWAGMHLRDVFGRTIYEEQDFSAELLPDGTVIREARREKAPVLNPDYDPATPYTPRTQRPEWAAVGMMGKLVAVDDGTCVPNGYCTVGEGGVATRSQERTPYRVMARLDETHIRVLIR